jgi:transposase
MRDCDLIGACAIRHPSPSCPLASAAQIEAAGGVDTHQDTHTAAVVDQAGRMLGHRTFQTTEAGYRQLLAWLGGFGRLQWSG